MLFEDILPGKNAALPAANLYLSPLELEAAIA
jgi:hypothetical protein